MKTKLPPRYTHRYDGHLARIAWPGVPELTIPLRLHLDGDEVEARRWKAHQGSTQARIARGGGFLAFDHRAEGFFHWRGHLGARRADRLTILRDLDLRGWTLTWPGEAAPIAIDATTDRLLVATVGEADRTAAPRARWFFFRPPDAGAPGWMLSFAGPTTAGAIELDLSGGFLDVALRDFDNAFDRGRFAGPYLVPALATLDDAARFHARLTGKEGYVRHNDRPRPWWFAPTLYATNDFLASLGGLDPEAAIDRVVALLDRAAATAAPPARGTAPVGSARGAILALDTHWCDAPGDWNPACPPLFADAAGWQAFRSRLADAHHHVLLAFPPFVVDPASALAGESPHFLLHRPAEEDDDRPAVDANGHRGSAVAASPDPALLLSASGAPFLDYTSPETRELLDDLLAHLLGDGPDQLAADGLVLEPLLGPPPRDAAWMDPTWSTGEHFWSRTLLHLAAAARRLRPASLLEVAGNDAILCRTGQRVRRHPVFGAALAASRDGGGGARDGALPRPPDADMVPGMMHVALAPSLDTLAATAAPAGFVLGAPEAIAAAPPLPS